MKISLVEAELFHEIGLTDKMEMRITQYYKCVTKSRKQAPVIK